MASLYFALREWVALIWGGGILAAVLSLGALATRRLAWPEALGLMMGMFSLGMGIYSVVWGWQHCVSSFFSDGVSAEGAKFGSSACLKWDSSPLVAMLEASILVGAAFAIGAAARLSPWKHHRWPFLAAGVLTLPEALMGPSPASLAIGLVPPVTLLWLGLLQRRAA